MLINSHFLTLFVFVNLPLTLSRHGVIILFDNSLLNYVLNIKSCLLHLLGCNFQHFNSIPASVVFPMIMQTFPPWFLVLYTFQFGLFEYEKYLATLLAYFLLFGN